MNQLTQLRKDVSKLLLKRNDLVIAETLPAFPRIYANTVLGFRVLGQYRHDNLRLELWLSPKLGTPASWVHGPMIRYAQIYFEKTDFRLVSGAAKELVSDNPEVWVESVESAKERFDQLHEQVLRIPCVPAFIGAGL